MNEAPPFSARATASLIANRDAASEDRLKAARALVERGLIVGVLRAIQDLAPEHALGVRKLVQQVQYVEQTMRWLDFSGHQQLDGHWETPAGLPAGEALGSTAALLWVHPGASRTAIAFSHVEGGFGPMAGWHSIALVHRVLRPLAVNVVYLLDTSRHLHFGPIPGLGEDYAGCLGRLRALFAERGWDRTYAFGVSSGGFSALRFGLDLGTRAVLSMSGPSRFDYATDPDRDPRMEGFYRDLPAFAVDLLPLYRAHSRRPRLLLCYGELNEYDRSMAERMTELPEVELIPFAGFADHSTFIEALRNAALGPLVERLFSSA